MRIKNTKKTQVIIGLLLAALLSGAVWLLTKGGSSEDQSSLDSNNQTQNITENSSGKTDLSQENEESNTNVETSEPENVENATVTVSEVEFQPIEEDEDPAEIPKLPVVTNHYKITQQSSDFFEIELFAILNKPEQYAEYQAQLAQFKQEALGYLSDNEFDIESSRISYIPAEAASL